MTYTFFPKEKHAKAYGDGLRISTKSAQFLCKVIRGKKLNVVKRLLNDLINEKRSLGGKYYTKTALGINDLLKSCENNAASLDMDIERLFVHASAHKGSGFRRRRRKAAFGSRLKSTNLEIILIEKGKEKKAEKKEEAKKKKEVKKKTLKTDKKEEKAEKKEEVKKTLKTDKKQSAQPLTSEEKGTGE